MLRLTSVPEYRCLFCSKTKDEVDRLIKGPTAEICICSKCAVDAYNLACGFDSPEAHKILATELLQQHPPSDLSAPDWMKALRDGFIALSDPERVKKIRLLAERAELLRKQKSLQLAYEDDANRLQIQIKNANDELEKLPDTAVISIEESDPNKA